MKFSDKFAQLRRLKGATIRDVASALNVGVGTVGGWSHGATPRPKVAKQLADYFKLPVEVLLDDEQELPEFLQIKPTAAAGAPRASNQKPEFAAYLKFLRQCREEAERLGKGDQQKTIEIFDQMLATYHASRTNNP